MQLVLRASIDGAMAEVKRRRLMLLLPPLLLLLLLLLLCKNNKEAPPISVCFVHTNIQLMSLCCWSNAAHCKLKGKCQD